MITHKENFDSKRRSLSKKIMYAVWGILAFYCAFYFSLKIWFSFYVVLSGTLLLTPFTIFLLHKKKDHVANIMFIISCNYYIYATVAPVGIEIQGAYYYLSATILPFLLFDKDSNKTKILMSAVTLSFWCLSEFVDISSFYPGFKATYELPLVLMRRVNFVGAFIVAVTFLRIFTSNLNEILESLVLEEKRAILNERLSTIGEVSVSIAHEINNPLAIIDGGLNILKRKIVSEPELKLIGGMIDSSKRIQRIIATLKKGMLSLSKEDEGRCYVRVRNIIEYSLAVLKFKAKDKNVTLSSAFSTQEDIEIYADEVQISQVVSNLISNAIDAVSDSESAWVKINMEFIEDQVSIRVTDSGCGIDDEIVEQMFNKFFTTKKGTGGTGIGLGIAKEIIEFHGGTIDYEKLDEHTSFVIVLKARTNEANDKSSEAA